MSTTGEATVNPDGTTTTTTTTDSSTNTPPNVGEDESQQQSEQQYAHTQESQDKQDTSGGTGGEEFNEEIPDSSSSSSKRTGTDPAIYLALSFITFVVLYMLHYKRQKKKQMDREAFFLDMDGDKFNIQLPAAVEEYYEVKEKCIQAGWEAGKPAANAKEAANGPTRILAQALMKRCMADIPLVTHIQKESSGMNKLYSQSMCSIKQWKSYQAAENLISQEVEEVRNEADEIEPGWSNMIWRQAMQYHNMLKNRNEMEAKQREEAMRLAAKKKEEEENKKTPEQIQKEKEAAAEKAAQELLAMEEKGKDGKKNGSAGGKAFKGGMKKGFLEKKK